MSRLMRYMINYQGNKIVTTHLKLSKPISYNLSPVTLEKVESDVLWRCQVKINGGYEVGVKFAYTLDGTDPTINSPTITDRYIDISSNCTVKVIAIVESNLLIRVSASVTSINIDDLRNGMPVYGIR